jgi:hypothetical protein
MRARWGRGGRSVKPVEVGAWGARCDVAEAPRSQRPGGGRGTAAGNVQTHHRLHPISHRRTPAPPQEDAIANPYDAYDARIDQALRTHKRKSRMVSLAIVTIGLLIVAVALLMGGRKREGRAASLAVGDDSTAVVRLLGAPPHRCEASNLAHLENQFPSGTPRPTIDEEIVRLRRGTVSRWVYPKGQGCVPDDGATEVGLDRQGQVLWVVPTRDKRPLVYEGAPT